MFEFDVGTVLKFLDKEFTIKSRCCKENMECKSITYQCTDEIGDTHVFTEELIVEEINREKGIE
jgi:hypothetical protein